MANEFSYDGDPANNQEDETRFLLQDTCADDPLMWDAEIAYLLAKEGTPLKAAIAGCDILAQKFARLADETVGDVSIKYSQISKRYSDLKKQYQNKLGIGSAGFYAGGISNNEKSTAAQDGDLVQPVFRKHKHENPPGSDDSIDDAIVEVDA